MHADLTITPLTPEHDAAMAAVIRRVMPEFGADGPGFAIHDPEVDALTEAYAGARSRYHVVLRDGRVVGGGGIAPLAGADEDVCELRKMYFLPEARGLGAGRALLDRLIVEARAIGFRLCYLETLTGMSAAQRLYEQVGFARIGAPMGATGHFGCDRWYALSLT
jgi:putative acetyltransferase